MLHLLYSFTGVFVLNFFSHEESSGMRHVRRIPHPARGVGSTRSRRANMHIPPGGSTLSGLSPNGRESMDPIAGLLLCFVLFFVFFLCLDLYFYLFLVLIFYTIYSSFYFTFVCFSINILLFLKDILFVCTVNLLKLFFD